VQVLLLDVRETEAWEACRIAGSGNYPHTRFHHATVPFSSELLAFKASGQSEKLIVLYDEDERFASACAELMFQKGFDNVFVVTGGIRRVLDKVPYLVQGSLSSPGKSNYASSVAGSVRSAARVRQQPKELPAKPTGERGVSYQSNIPSAFAPVAFAPSLGELASQHQQDDVRFQRYPGDLEQQQQQQQPQPRVRQGHGGQGYVEYEDKVGDYDGPVSPVKHRDLHGGGGEGVPAPQYGQMEGQQQYAQQMAQYMAQQYGGAANHAAYPKSPQSVGGRSVAGSVAAASGLSPAAARAARGSTTAKYLKQVRDQQERESGQIPAYR